MPSMTGDGRINETEQLKMTVTESGTYSLVGGLRRQEKGWFESQMDKTGALDPYSPLPTTFGPRSSSPGPQIPPPPAPVAVEAQEYFNKDDAKQSDDWEDLGVEGAIFNMDLE